MLKRANAEKWADLRKNAENKSVAKVEQKTANLAAENATIAERIRGKLLKHLEAEIDALPETFGTESTKKTVKKEKGKDTILSKTLKLRDLVAAYNDLTNTDIKREKLELEKKRIEEESW